MQLQYVTVNQGYCLLFQEKLSVDISDVFSIDSLCLSSLQSLCEQRTGERTFSAVMNNCIQRWNGILKYIGIGT